MTIAKFMILILFVGSYFAGAQNFGERLQKTSGISDLLTLKDPFRSPLVKKKKKKTKGKRGLLKNGVYTNLASIGDIDINNLEIIGVLVGKNRRALARIPGNRNHFILKEGMKIGQNQAELKAILPGGVVLVEKLNNLYGEEEYLETIIPITE